MTYKISNKSVSISDTLFVSLKCVLQKQWLRIQICFTNCSFSYSLLQIFSYFKDGLQTIEHFGTYISDLSNKLHKIKQRQDEDRRSLLELRTLLRSTPDFDRVENVPTDKGGGCTGYSLHQLQGDKLHGVTRSGHLLKKSEGKVRRVWQKRRCRVTSDGFLDIFHADETKPPTRVNLLTCQIKPVPDDKRGFDLISCK